VADPDDGVRATFGGPLLLYTRQSMMNQFKAALVTTCLCSGLATPALAGNTAVVEVTLDTSFIQRGSNPDEFTGNATGGFSPPFSVDLAAGDTLDMTIDFAGSQTLTIDGLDTIWAFSFANLESDVDGNGRFQFLGADGSVLLESLQKSSVEGAVHFGQSFFADDFQNLPNRITFSGVRYVGTVVSYLDPGVASRTYDAPGFAFDAVSFTTAVPEPGTWALMLVGAGVLAATARRRRLG
jgi:hypothetical protein